MLMMRIKIHVYVVQASLETTTARRPRSRMRRQVHTHSQSLVREHSVWKYIIYLLYILVYIISSWDTYRPWGWSCPWIFFPAKHCQPILLCASGNHHQQYYESYNLEICKRTRTLRFAAGFPWAPSKSLLVQRAWPLLSVLYRPVSFLIQSLSSTFSLIYWHLSQNALNGHFHFSSVPFDSGHSDFFIDAPKSGHISRTSQPPPLGEGFSTMSR